ncbi:MAG: hydrogenase [Acidobacteriota bacterium]
MIFSNAVVIGKVLNLFSVLLLVAAIAVVANLRIASVIRAYGAQGFALAAMTALIAYSTGREHIYAIALAGLVIKAVLIPTILTRIVRNLKIKHDIEPFLSVPLSVLVCGLLVVLAYFVAEPFESAGLGLIPNLLAISVSLVLIGCFVMIIRKKAITQVIGLLTMENGIFLSALATTFGMPLIVELGIFFDLLLGAIIFGLFAYRIKETFDHLDTTRLQSLKG